MKFTAEQAKNLRIVQNDPTNQRLLEQAVARRPSPIVAGLPPAEPKRDSVPALEQKPKRTGSGKSRVVVVVTLIRCGLRELDEVNLKASFKGLQDAIATSLGVDDADRRVLWNFGQCPGRGPRGTIVKIDFK